MEQDDPPVKHTRRASEMDANDVMVRFSPQVVRGFARLEAAVYDSEHFSPEILENLRDYTAGAPLSVQAALTAIAVVTRETMKHVNATGDETARKALDQFTSDLLGLGQTNTPPVTVLNPRRRSR